MHFRSILFFWSFILAFAREPLFFLEPRFWAEEGTEFFQFAYTHSFWEMVTTPLVGYYTLFNIITSHLALLLPLEYAPTVTTYLSLCIQMIPIAIIIYTDFILWDTRYKKIILTFIITMITPLELWMNSTNSHILFGLISFLISISSNESISFFRKWGYRILLVLGTLTGPASSFSAPIFWIRSYRERTREILIQTGIITVCALTQVAIVIYSALYKNKYNRFSNFDFFRFLENYIRDSFGLLLPFEQDTLVLLGIYFAIYFFYLVIINIKRTDYQYLTFSFIIITTLSILGSLAMKGSPRYSFIPTIILYLILVDEFSRQKLKLNVRQIAISLFLILSITLSLHSDIREEIKFRSPLYPKWKQEAKLFKENHNYKPKVHPHSDNWTWELKLQKESGKE